MTIVCHLCHKTGHKQRRCPTKRANNERDKTKDAIAKELEKFEMIQKKNDLVLMNEEEIMDFIWKCRGREITIHYDIESERIGLYLDLGKHLDFNFTSTSRGKHLNFPYLGDEVIANCFMNINLREFIIVLKKYPVFSKISCDLNSISHCDVLSELKKAGKIKYEMVCEDKRSGPNLTKYLEIDNKLVNYNPFDDINSPDVFGRFKQVILGLYGELKGIDDVESLLNHPCSLDIIYK